jgi:hypothetical protein
MEELVKTTEIVDAQLVRAVTALMPGESIERILDETRVVTLKRVFNALKIQKFKTVIHMAAAIEAAGLYGKDAVTVLSWFDDQEVSKLLDSGLLDSIFNFISEKKPSTRRVWCCIHPKTQ